MSELDQSHFASVKTNIKSGWPSCLREHMSIPRELPSSPCSFGQTGAG